MKRLRLIVNADDFGMCESTNYAIEHYVLAGKVQSASLLANGDGFVEAVSALKGFGKCSIGAHLNLTQFRPLSASFGLKPLLDDSGLFIHNEIRRVSITKQMIESIIEEWMMQISRIRENGVEITHLDSHHHVHTIPRLFWCLREVCRLSGISCVRLTTNIGSSNINGNFVHLLKKKLWNVGLRYAVANVTTDGFSSLETFLDAAHHKMHRFNTVEIMVHPRARGFETETEILDSNWWEQIPREIEFINFRDLI